jgi:membrane-associated HD superfamily phosphohydrolase
MKNKRLIIILIVVAVILTIPLVAMQFTTEVNWSLFDFAVAGILLLGTGLIIELILRNVKLLNHRILLSVIVLFILFLVWAELAVGLFGTPFAGS